ncbi:MAG: Kelch repeat-containing protein [Planctomycetota bacterium]
MNMRVTAVLLVAVLTLGSFGCSKDDDSPPPPPPDPPPVPVIVDINSSTDPKSPIDVAIEINGSGFLDSVGLVRFDDGVSPVDVTPNVAGWSGTSIVVVVPNTFVPPLTVGVSVITANGTSNVIDLDLVSVPAFTPVNLAWATSTAMPEGLRGLKGTAVYGTASRGYVFVSGGQTGGGSPLNQSDCRFLGVNMNAGTFSVDGTWTDVTALPASRAFHAMATAHSANSIVGQSTAVIYVVGGQALATDGTTGTTTVYRTNVDPSDGSLAGWTTTTALPAPRWGHDVLVYRGLLFVMGGYDDSGVPQDTIHVAPIQSDGSLGSFTASPTPLPLGIGSLTAAAFGGHLYVVGGETTVSPGPNDSTVGGELLDSQYATLTNGVIGTFFATGTTTLGKVRKKHVLWSSFGQLVVAEGVYPGALGSNEMSSNDINADGTLGAWEGLTGGNVANADTFNCAAVTSPLSPSTGPRFFLIGGDDFSGNGVSTVWINTSP